MSKGNKSLLQEHTNSHLLRSPRAKPQFNVILCRGPQSGRPRRAVWRTERVLFGVLSIKETREVVAVWYPYYVFIQKVQTVPNVFMPAPPPFPKKKTK